MNVSSVLPEGEDGLMGGCHDDSGRNWSVESLDFDIRIQRN